MDINRNKKTEVTKHGYITKESITATKEQSRIQKLFDSVKTFFTSFSPKSDSSFSIRHTFRKQLMYDDFSEKTVHKYTKDIEILKNKIQTYTELNLNDMTLLVHCGTLALEEKTDLPQELNELIQAIPYKRPISTEQHQTLQSLLSEIKKGKKNKDQFIHMFKETLSRVIAPSQFPPLSCSKPSNLSFKKDEWSSMTSLFEQQESKRPQAYPFFYRSDDIDGSIRKLKFLKQFTPFDTVTVEDQQKTIPEAFQLSYKIDELIQHLQTLNELKNGKTPETLTDYSKIQSLIVYFNVPNEMIQQSDSPIPAHFANTTSKGALSSAEAKEISQLLKKVKDCEINTNLTPQNLSHANIETYTFSKQLELYQRLNKKTVSGAKVIDQIDLKRFPEIQTFYDEFSKIDWVVKEEKTVLLFLKFKFFKHENYTELAQQYSDGKFDLSTSSLEKVRRFGNLSNFLSSLKKNENEINTEVLKNWFGDQFPLQNLVSLVQTKEEAEHNFLVSKDFFEKESNHLQSVLSKIKSFNSGNDTNKFSVSEYYFLKELELDYIPIPADKKELIRKFRDNNFRLLGDKSEKALVCFLNAKKQLIGDKRPGKVEQIVYKHFLQLSHVALITKRVEGTDEEERHSVSLGEADTVYDRIISPYAHPNMDYFQVDTTRLANHLNIPANQQSSFEDAFYKNLQEILTRESKKPEEKMEYSFEEQSIKNMVLRYFRSKVHLNSFKKEKFYLESKEAPVISSEKELVCVDFVVHAIIEATAKAYEETLPDAKQKPNFLHALGFSRFQAAGTFTPVQAYEAMTKAKLLKQHQPLEKFVSFEPEPPSIQTLH